VDIDLETLVPKTPVTERITNNFMIGRIAVGIVLMESTGHLLDWTHDEEIEAIAEAVEGYEYLTQQAELRNVNISWVYEIHKNVLTALEPIQTLYPYRTGFPDFNWKFGWIDDALDYLEAGEEWDGIFNYANRIRNFYKTNWAFTLFIVKNNEIYYSFPNGAAGYTKTYEQYPGEKIRPPFAVSTYLYSGYNADLSSRVVAHESAHVFGAMDEYKDSEQCSSIFSCNDVGGYLRYPNMNCYYCGIYEPCLMQAEPEKMDICPYTAGHIGWVDSDNDGAPDPIDPNSNRWASIIGPTPGDLVRIFTIDNDFVNSIACTEDNVGAGNWILWDGRNFDNLNCVTTEYYANINGGDLFTIYLHSADTSIQPILANVADNNSLINWELEESFAYITCEVYDYFDSLIARPLWNKLYAIGSYQVDISDIYCSTYRIKLVGWRPDGGLSNVVELDIPHDQLLAPTYITASNHYDHQSIKVTFNDSNICESGWIIERKSVSDQSWQVIDTLPTNDYEYVYYEDYYPLGSETYTYRVKGFTSNQQNAPYSNNVTITARPRWPANLMAYATDCTDSLPANPGCDLPAPKMIPAKAVSGDPDEDPLENPIECHSKLGNDITVRWSRPSNQKYPIVKYIVERCNTLGTPLESWTLTGDTCMYICPVGTQTSYKMYVYLVASNGDTSLPAIDGICTGDINICPGVIPRFTDDEDVILPDKTELRQNYPNPFNLSTEISFSLAENSRVTVDIYDLLGRKIIMLTDRDYQPGIYSVSWDGCDQNGGEVSSGIYLYRIKAGEYVESRKMMLLK